MLQTPVIFVVDARSITRSAAALVKGYMDFDPEVSFKGVILNKVGSERHAEKARREIERYAGAEVVGVIRRNDDMHLAMRHLGLVPVLEGKTRHEGFEQRLQRIREIVEEGLDMDRIFEIARAAPPLPEVAHDLYKESSIGKGVRIGVAMDEAFNFYYRDNLEQMELCRSKGRPFQPGARHLPAGCGRGLYRRRLSGALRPGAVREPGHAKVPAEGSREEPAHLRRVRRADVPGQRDRMGRGEEGDGRIGSGKGAARKRQGGLLCARHARARLRSRACGRAHHGT